MPALKSPKFMCHPNNRIDALPVELLTRIFTLGAGFNYLYEESPFLLKPNQDYYPPPSSFQILVSHVCQRWRTIALQTPTLWTTLHLGEPVHLARAAAYLERCSTSSTYLLDILVDTVASEDHIEGVTLCRDEIVQVFDLIIPHVRHWRSFHLKIRDNQCKLQARHYLSTCGPAPLLETLQLYHFEDYGTSQDLYLATYRPPVVVFSNTVPRLRNVSLIGVNLPWLKSPYLMNLHKLELALHLDSIRPPYHTWDRMLRLSPQMQSLYLCYSGPRSQSGAAGDQQGSVPWPPGKEKIELEELEDLKLTDLDPGYLCEVVERLYLPSVKKVSLHLPDQNFSPFIDLVTRRDGIEESSASRASGSSVLAEVETRRQSKIAISSLLSSDSDDISQQQESPTGPVECSTYKATKTVSAATARCDVRFDGPLPNLSRLETLVITALDCSPSNWQTLLRCLEGLKHLEVDFRRMGTNFWKVFAGISEVDQAGRLLATGLPHNLDVLLPQLQSLKVAGVPGIDLKGEIQRRAAKGSAVPGLKLCVVRWAPNLEGDDLVMDELVKFGQCRVGEGTSQNDFRVRIIKVETYYDDEEDELEEELEPEEELEEDPSLDA
ncbi:hypothetical protein MD484_g4289, partial [Candolleomyces efflorescens]